MPVSATIEVMTLASVLGQQRAVVPTAALTRYFRPLGVELKFQQGATLAEADDPSQDSEAMAEFCAARAPAPGGTDRPAILVVSNVAPEGKGINGQLMDSVRRGACAVYAGSTVFKELGAEERFEVYVHELGHLFNLLHPEPDGNPERAMAQFGDRRRVTDRRALWRQVIEDADVSYRGKLSAFFGAGTGSPIGLPMSSDCCDLLVDRLTSDVAPWGGEFADPSQGSTDDVAFGTLDCTLALESDRLQVAQPLDFSLSLQLRRGEKAGDIPAELDLRSGNVRLELAGPSDGNARKLLPDGHTCGSMRRRLRPGQKARRHYSVFSDRNGLALPSPGTYRLRAVLPGLGVRSEWVHIDVQPAPALLAQPALLDFMRRGQPSRDGRLWHAVDEMIAGSDVPAATRAHLALVGAARHLQTLRPLRAMRAIAPPRIAERDALLRIAHWQREGNHKKVHNAIDVAERLFAACDSQHATLSYLRQLRNNEYARDAATRRET